ncbi:MAG: hypothetical protein JRE64_14995 [Deltaproteobacteria bacterium]|nr:hypothetical protein [Deltaproteobacteria bacterium]
MKAKDSKQKRAAFSAVQPSNISGIRPGYINFGSHLNQRNSLSARVKAEIDRRLHFCRKDKLPQVGAQIWVEFVRSQITKVEGIASYFNIFGI